MAHHHRHAAHHKRQGQEFWDNLFSSLTDLIFEQQAQTPAAETNKQMTITDAEFWESVTRSPAPATTTEKLETATSAKGAPVQATSTAETKTTLRALTRTSASSSLPTAIVPTTESSLDLTLAVAPTSSTDSSTSTSATASATPTAPVESTADSSGAAKAGIAIGVLAGVFVVFLAVWFIFNRRKRQMQEKQQIADDEKINGPFADSHAIKTPVAAPRLSLRPVTQFLPNLNTGVPERRASRAASTLLAPSPHSPLNRRSGASAWERPTTDSLTVNRPGTSTSAHPSNPFNDNQVIREEPEDLRPVSPMGSDVGVATTANKAIRPVSPMVDTAAAVAASANSTSSSPSTPTAAVGIAAAAAIGSAAAGVGLARKASIRKDVPKPLDLTKPPTLGLDIVPPSPAGTEYSVHSVAPGQSPGPSTSAAAIAAAGGPAQSTVHRVQLDFKPTLEDEMGLRAGQLVRLLHEYDDGWALCIRLDRSQQGVVPRTCLSMRPVKPRPPQNGGPRGPPVNPQRGPGFGPGPNYPRGPGNGMPPHGGPGPYGPPPNGPPRGPPQGPGGYPRRPESPGGPMLMDARNGPRQMMGGPGAPRPQSPGPRFQQQQGRPQSPGPRPQSPNGMTRRMTPPGPSHMNQEHRPSTPAGIPTVAVPLAGSPAPAAAPRSPPAIAAAPAPASPTSPKAAPAPIAAPASPVASTPVPAVASPPGSPERSAPAAGPAPGQAY